MKIVQQVSCYICRKVHWAEYDTVWERFEFPDEEVYVHDFPGAKELKFFCAEHQPGTKIYSKVMEKRMDSAIKLMSQND